MKINLKYKAMSILMSSLNETQMWAVYQLGMDNEIPSRVTKADLTSIIVFLFKQLDWIEDGESKTACNVHTIVEQEIQDDSQSCENQTEKNSEQPTFYSVSKNQSSAENCK